jgi:hypothetical protein
MEALGGGAVSYERGTPVSLGSGCIADMGLRLSVVSSSLLLSSLELSDTHDYEP